LINDFRFQRAHVGAVTQAGDTLGPGVEIAGLGRFGTYDSDSTRRELRYQVVNNLSLSHSQSEWKGGVTVNHVSLNSELRDGFGALYTFRTLDDFAAGRPAIWRQAFGSPANAIWSDQFRVVPSEPMARYATTNLNLVAGTMWSAYRHLSNGQEQL